MIVQVIISGMFGALIGGIYGHRSGSRWRSGKEYVRGLEDGIYIGRNLVETKEPEESDKTLEVKTSKGPKRLSYSAEVYERTFLLMLIARFKRNVEKLNFDGIKSDLRFIPMEQPKYETSKAETHVSGSIEDVFEKLEPGIKAVKKARVSEDARNRAKRSNRSASSH